METNHTPAYVTAPNTQQDIWACVIYTLCYRVIVSHVRSCTLVVSIFVSGTCPNWQTQKEQYFKTVKKMPKTLALRRLTARHIFNEP